MFDIFVFTTDQSQTDIVTLSDVLKGVLAVLAVDLCAVCILATAKVVVADGI